MAPVLRFLFGLPVALACIAAVAVYLVVLPLWMVAVVLGEANPFPFDWRC